MVGKRNKQTGCIGLLNEVLKEHHGFFIDKKELKYYREMSKPYSKIKSLSQCAKMNDSLRIFLSSLPDSARLPAEDEE